MFGLRGIFTRLRGTETDLSPDREVPRKPGQVAIAAALVVVCAAQLYLLPAGFFADDLGEAAAGRDASVGQIARLEPAPSLLPLLAWKLAVKVAPEEPYAAMRIFYAAVHVLNAGLLVLFLRPLVGGGIAGLAAAVFLLYRPSAPAVLWAAAGKETLILCGTLASLLLWRRGSRDVQWRWLALAPAVLAMASKPTAVLLPVVLAAHSFWLERRDGRAWLPRDVIAPLAVLVVANGLLAVNAVLRPGWWIEFEALAPAAERIDVLGRALLRNFTLVYPYPEVPYLGWVVLAAAAVALFCTDRRVRFGLLWGTAFLAPPIMTMGITNPHYAYNASAGALLVMGTAAILLVRAGAGGRVVAASLAVVWLAADLALFAKDTGELHACYALSRETRQQLAPHGEAFCDGCELGMENPPLWIELEEIVRYDHRAEVELRRRTACEDPEAPACVRFAFELRGSAQCPGADVASFVRWAGAEPAPVAAGPRPLPD